MPRLIPHFGRAGHILAIRINHFPISSIMQIAQRPTAATHSEHKVYTDIPQLPFIAVQLFKAKI